VSGERGTGNGERTQAHHAAPVLALDEPHSYRALPSRCSASCSPFPVSPRTSRTKRAKGFSLLEVIAAILLLAIAFTALMQVAGGAIGLTQNAADYSRAALWARSLLDTADVVAPLRPGRSEGRFDAQYRWRLTVTPSEAGQGPAMPFARPVQPAQPVQALKLDLDVLWGEGRRERSAHFSTLRLAPVGTGNSPVITQ